MVTSKTYIRLLKATSCGVFASGGIWVCFQMQRSYRHLNNVLKVDVLELEKKRAEYIYLQDPHFKDEMCLVQGKTEGTNSALSVFNLPMRRWEAWKRSYAWRLLSMAKNGSRSDHLRAVHTLASLSILTDSDKRQLAQVCDERTAIGLARTEGVDLRFFHPPPNRHIVPTKEELMKRLDILLSELNIAKHHLCIQHFRRKAFPFLHQKHPNVWDDLLSGGFHTRLIRDEEILPLCMKSILHHSSIEDNAKDIVKFGGLPLLMDLCMYFHKDVDMLIMLGKVMSYISAHKEMLHDIFISGWVGMLAKWSQNSDVRLSAPAARALANLDEDYPSEGKYLRHIYLLHPTCRRAEAPATDVVFVHGLLGGVFVTWRQRDPIRTAECSVKWEDLPEQSASGERAGDYHALVKQEEWDELVLHGYELVMTDCPENASDLGKGPFICSGNPKVCKYCPKLKHTQCWPKDWLAHDCHYLRIIGINYDTYISEWSSKCPAEHFKRSLEDRSNELLQKLRAAGVGSRPIVWVCHSMGGLLVKSMLTKSWESGDKFAGELCRNTKGIVFYSVPHLGSPLAALTQTSSMVLWPSIEVQELRENSPALVSLHERFLSMLAQFPIEVISFAETKHTKISTLPSMQFNFVPLDSANPGIGEFFAIPQDHLCICKPATRQSFLYQKVLKLIHDCRLSS